ncbi:putative IQ motif, EF-hand binding protein [Helianthus annuus]|nr:putative IQ motif, EF-hand binding protein [Helianthus annuus]
MGKKGNWFSSIKKSFSPSSKEKKSQSEQQGVVEEQKQPSVPDTPIIENVDGSCDSHPFSPPEETRPLGVQPEPPQTASVNITVAESTAVAAVMTQYAGKSQEEVAAIIIQTVFRGYLARRAFWGLRGLVRLKTVIEGPCARRQTVNTLKCIQSLSHLQSQISSRRFRMSEEIQALQKQLLRNKETANMQTGDEWDDRVQSKEEIEAKLLSKYDAAMRREKAMAYSFSHQQPWKKSGGTATKMLFMNPTNPQWGWSWSERYKDHGTDHLSVRSGIDNGKSEIAKSYARHQLNSAPSTPRSKGANGPVASPTPKTGPNPRAIGLGPEANLDDDSKSVSSVKSERIRRHSVAGSMVAAKSAKVKSRGQGVAENGGAKKHLSFQVKPRRHSGPPKVEPIIGDGLELARVT